MFVATNCTRPLHEPEDPRSLSPLWAVCVPNRPLRHSRHVPVVVLRWRCQSPGATGQDSSFAGEVSEEQGIERDVVHGSFGKKEKKSCWQAKYVARRMKGAYIATVVQPLPINPSSPRSLHRNSCMCAPT